MTDAHSYAGEFPGWCACDHWCDTEQDYHAHLAHRAHGPEEAAT